MDVRTTMHFLRRLLRIPAQLLGINPFAGEMLPKRVPLIFFGADRPTLPIPHPWNYREPIRILDCFFWGKEEQGSGKHNRYLNVPGFAPVLVTRDPRLIRAIATQTGDHPGQFDRDTLPSVGIARATGTDTLLYANGPFWRMQKKLAAAPFGKTTLFQPEEFHEFADTFRHTVRQRLDVLEHYLQSLGSQGSVSIPVRIPLEAEIKPVMLEMLTNNFFGTAIDYAKIRSVYVPALERVIEHIVRDTVLNKLGIPFHRWFPYTPALRQLRQDFATFEELTDLVLVCRKEGRGHWKQFRSEAPDKALRSNLKVFLAGALEATTSYASWAIAHLARNPLAQEKVYAEVADIDDYTPDHLSKASYLNYVLEETLRLTPSLYFLPRRASSDTWVEVSEKERLFIPQGTHILLDVWHANRHEDHWGVAVSGYPAAEFFPERWERLSTGKTKDTLHFGFGHGPRVCPGKHLGQLEVALVVGAFVKLFRFQAVQQDLQVKAGVSTKPHDGVLVEMQLRKPRVRSS